VNPEVHTTPAEVAATQNEFRKTFIQVVGGVFAVVALYLTWRRVRVTEQGHITDRYTKAIEQLGALTADGRPNIEVRLGAIYALERIAIDSRRDHWTIMEVLTAYVRQNAPAPTETNPREDFAKGPSTEVQAILTVLGRRLRGGWREREGRWLDLGESDLRGAYLYGAHFSGAHFELAHVGGAKFYSAHLQDAWFSSAHVEGATFLGAHLERASFSNAHVSSAMFYRAHGEGASFIEAHAEGAMFIDSHLGNASFYKAYLNDASFRRAHVAGAGFERAHVSGAKFNSVNGLNAEQVRTAIGWEQAVYDDAFAAELGLSKASGWVGDTPAS
jgi:uncharacterized protein YjbI with pentapeptide repeats